MEQFIDGLMDIILQFFRIILLPEKRMRVMWLLLVIV
jgi:hypothetical protein